MGSIQRPLTIASFSSFVLRCLGTGTIVASDLAAARNVAHRLEMPAKTLEQLVDQPGLCQRLAKQPDRGGIRHRVLQFQIEKVHERYAVAVQVLGLLIREIVQRLQHHDLELQDRIVGLRPALLLRSSGFVSVTASMSARKSFPRHDLLDRL
jgi:hypothetical protein